MRIRNLTDFPVGFRVTSRRPSAPEMALIVRAVFTIVPGGAVSPPAGIPLLAQGALRGAEFAPGDDERAGECLYPDDFAEYKPRAEVLLRGTCHTPGGGPMTECPVRFAVGAWSKILRVVGRRVWVDDLLGGTISDPLPFTSMPLGYANAFGGPGYPSNPVGKGYGTSELPHVEHAGEIVRSRGDRPPPAGFGPINAVWPQRASKLGTEYGRSYAKRAPYYPEDFDWTHFNAAPEDQQLPSFLKGDEEILFQNLHPTIPLLRTRLPGLRIRAFVATAARGLEEVGMSLDTLFADVDAGTVTLTWRGLAPVKEDDLRDVETVLVASEAPGEPHRPVTHYRAVAEEMARDPARAAIPEEMRPSWDALRAGGGEGAAGPDGALDPVSALLGQRLGGFAPEAQAEVQRAIAQLAEKAAGPAGVNLHEALAKALQQAAPGSAPLVPGQPVNDARIDAAYQRIAGRVAELKKRAAARGIEIPDLEKFEKLPENAGAASLGIRPLDERRRSEEPGPGKDLSGQDLSGRDLSGQDLSGANLAGAILAGANLRGTRLANANLQRAVLSGADAGGADLSGADLSHCNATGLLAAGADLGGACLDHALLERANLAGAKLAGAAARQALFLQTDLTGADASGASFTRCLFHEATMGGARLAEARIEASSLSGVKAAEADLTRATLTGSGFDGADLTGALLREARGERVVFTGATMDRADFGHADLPFAELSEVKGQDVRFTAASLKDARFYRATLEAADLERANLFGADLGKATLRRARFAGASLYEAKLLGAELTGCDFAGANLKRSTLERA